MHLVFNNPNWIVPYSAYLGLGLFTCFGLNVAGTIQGFRRYKQEGKGKKERVAAWLNLALVLFFMTTLFIPNIIDLYNAINGY